MSRSDNGSAAHLSYSSSSRPASKARSLDHLARAELKGMAALNVLFLGETNLGECSIINLIAGPGDQESDRYPASHCAPVDNVRSITHDGKMFILRALPANESMSTEVVREGIQRTLTGLRKKGGVHLLVYCMNTSHSTLWAPKVHRAIASDSFLPSLERIPAVAVVFGLSDGTQEESWWSDNEDTWARQGLRFDDHTFTRLMAVGAESPTGGRHSEIRHALHALIRQNCSDPPKLFMKHFSYQQLPMASSFQSLIHMMAGKPPSHVPTTPKEIDIVLLGEIGVGKSSLINLIAKKDVASVSADAMGCTRTVDMHTFEERGKTFHLYDTPGLVDPLMGPEPFIDPIDTIQKKIRSIGNGNGPDLLLFCIDNSKPTAALQRNYRLFCKIICGGKVPFALVITKLEEGQDSSQWWDRHKAAIRGYGIDCSGHIGIGRETKHLDVNVDVERQRREALLSFFVACTDRHKKKKGSLRSTVGRTVGSLTTFLRSPASTPERTLMNQCGLEEQIAGELVRRLVASEQSCE